jgi:hypothetical protein
VASYITSDLLKAHPDARILADEQQAYTVILMSDAYQHFIMRRQPNFPEILAHPQGNVDYILIPNVRDGSNLITARYPEMYDGKVPFLELVRTFPGALVPEWRLFRVLPAGESSAQPVSPGATATAAPAATADATWPTIVDEHFDAPSERFPSVRHANWSSTYQDGRYQVQLDGRPSISYSVPLPHDDFRLGVDVQIGRGQAGLFFLIDKPDDFYRFLIDTQGRYRLERQAVGVSQPLIDWTASQALRPGTDAVNRIEVRRVGDEIALYGNDVLLATYTLPPTDTERSACIGLAVDTPSDTHTGSAWFDNLVVRGPTE